MGIVNELAKNQFRSRIDCYKYDHGFVLNLVRLQASEVGKHNMKIKEVTNFTGSLFIESIIYSIHL